MQDIKLTALAEKIKAVFVEQDKYFLEKKITEFAKDEKIIGDWLNFLMSDPSTTPPTYYEVTSPYDAASNTAPQYALVFRDGICIFQTDYTDYAALRTGLLDSVLLEGLGVETLKDKKVLLVGAGKTASWSLKGLKAHYPDLAQITYMTSDKPRQAFEQLAESLQIKAGHTTDSDISRFDIVLCHTSAPAPLFTDPQAIKKGAILAGYISSKYVEFADTFYDSARANLLIDWHPNLERMKFVSRQTEAGKVDTHKIGDFRDMLTGKFVPDPKKDYTLFTSIGTPLQNLAVLKMLTGSTEH